MLQTNFNKSVENVIVFLSRHWNNFNEGKKWLDECLASKGQDTQEILQSFVDDFKLYESDLKEKDFLFMRDKKIKIPILNKLHFTETLHDPDILESDFRQVTCYIYNFWTQSNILVFTRFNPQLFDKYVRKGMKNIFMTEGALTPGKLDLGNLISLGSNIIKDPDMLDDMSEMLSTFKVGDAASLCNQVGLDKEKINNISKVLPLEEEKSVQSMTNLFLNKLNSTDEEVKSKSIMEVFGTGGDIKETIGEALKLINEGDGVISGIGTDLFEKVLKDKYVQKGVSEILDRSMVTTDQKTKK